MRPEAWLAVLLTLAVVAVALRGSAAARRPGLARVRVEGDELVVEPFGVLKVLSLTGGVHVPVAAVTAARAVDRPQDRFRPGMRLAGTWLPGLFAGTFVGDDGRSFWLVGRGETAVRLDLEDARYAYVVVDVDDPESTLVAVHRARRP